MVGHSSDSAINKAQSLLQNMSHSASDDYLKHAHEFTKEAIGEFLARHEALHSQVPLMVELEQVLPPLIIS